MISVMAPESICSDGAPVSLYYAGCTDGSHIDRAVEAALTAIGGTERRMNPYMVATNEEELRGRLTLAATGGLVPADQVAAIRADPTLPLYEIRWIDDELKVEEQRPDGVWGRRGVHVRFYYAEHFDGSRRAILLHVHEKVILEGDSDATRAAQDAEIAAAIKVYVEGTGSGWGVPELQG